MEIKNSSENTDFLRFSAYSFKDLITRKLSETTKFTDQIYEGSNLAILIDLCSYLFQGLTFCLNSAAAESMFSDTQIYKNISRLVKLIGYHPKGFIPSTCEFEFKSETDNVLLPKFAAIDTGKTDGKGNKVYYSFADSEPYQCSAGVNLVRLYNGQWKLHNTIFVASGVKYETFTLDGVRSDSSNNSYAAHGFIEVYVDRDGEFLKFKGITDELFMNSSSKYDGTGDAITIFKNTDEDRYFSIRLNDNKEYEIKFGNDNNGQKLKKGDQIYVFYLDSNGFDGKLNIGEVQNKPLIEPSSMLGLHPETLYKNIMKYSGDYSDVVDTLNSGNITLTNTSTSTEASREESVEDIREIAPDYYKLGNRLISKGDYEYYVKNRFKENIIDVKCQNNWDYISTFFGWLYRLGKTGVRTEYTSTLSHTRAIDPKYYINHNRLTKYDYKFADPADQNNVYLWIEMQNGQNIWKQTLDEELLPIKVLTSETVFVDPIHVKFALCASPITRALDYLDADILFDKNCETYLEITITDNSLYTNSSIKTQIEAIFSQYFDQLHLSLGMIVSPSEIEKEIYNINGVQRVRTIFSCPLTDESGQKIYQDRYIDGISFASWSTTLIDTGDDLAITTSTRTLEDFQIPEMDIANIKDKIKIIKKSFSNNSTVQY